MGRSELGRTHHETLLRAVINHEEEGDGHGSDSIACGMPGPSKFPKGENCMGGAGWDEKSGIKVRVGSHVDDSVIHVAGGSKHGGNAEGESIDLEHLPPGFSS